MRVQIAVSSDLVAQARAPEIGSSGGALRHSDHRVLVPLIGADAVRPTGWLAPVNASGGERYVAQTDAHGAVPARLPGTPPGSLFAGHEVIEAALDMLLPG